MKTSAVSRISASIPNGKKAKFNLSHDVNTSYDWGSCQPLFGKLMLPDSTMNIKLEQLTRLAPMVVPTFGRVKMKNVAHFVPIQEIFPNWEGLMSQTKVSRPTLTGSTPGTATYVPKYVPSVHTNLLSMFCLAGAQANIYFSGVVGTSQENDWVCARNTGTWAAPAGFATATYACRALGQALFGIADRPDPPTYILTDFNNYNGYSWNLRRIPLDKNGNIMITASNAPIAALPTITTATAQPLANANGYGYTHSFSNEQNTYDSALGDDHISFDGADMIWEYAGSDPTVGISSADRAANSGTPMEGFTNAFFDTRKVRVVFKLSSFGKRLRKILIGLGYDVNFQNDDIVSILPLIAFYKAWWDTYAPQRYKNFYETAAWKLIQTTMQSSSAAVMTGNLYTGTSTPQVTFFRQFISDLGTCFATDKMDVISAATDRYYGQANTTTDTSGHTELQSEILQAIHNAIYSPGTSVSTDVYGADGSLNTILANMSDTNVQTTPAGGIGIKAQYDQHMFTQPQINALKKAYIMLNKSSVAGMKVEEILRALGYGDYVEECKGKFIQGSADNVKISDVVATAATEDAQLGQYGGRGLGLSNLQFSFNAREHGYLIVISAIVPESGYVNSPAVENEAISFDKMYNPELDGLAFEAIEKKQIAGTPLVNDPTYSQTFGFLPTYTQWKYMSNKANGDFSLNSRKNYMLPYTLDKYIPVTDSNVYRSEPYANAPGSTVEYCSPSFRYSDLPNAGEDWRFINKFPWNGNYNRIFSAQGDGWDWSVFSPNNSSFLYNSFEFDNFMTHNVFDVQYWAHMKSIEDSYGTYDEEHGAPNTSISKS